MEVRISGDGHTVIKVPCEETCYHLYHSKVVDNTGKQDVAVALSGAVHTVLLVWLPMSFRLASARLKRTTVNLNVVPVNASMLDAAE